MPKIEPLVDKYGNLVRESFLADYMELLALRKRKARKGSLSDAVMDIAGEKKEILFDPTRPSSSEWTPEVLVEDAWQCLWQRSEVLGDRYPFVVSESQVKLKPDVDPTEYPYVVLLAIAAAHAFSLVKSNVAEYMLEATVARGMEHAGLAIGQVGAQSRTGASSFTAVLEEVGETLRVTVAPNSRVRRVAAKDEDVDLVAEFRWDSGRKYRWFYIGQVTCAASDEWKKKLNEPQGVAWKDFLTEKIQPVPFLALPYHVSDPALDYLSESNHRLLDRLHLSAALADVGSDEKDLIMSVVAADMLDFRV